MVWIFGSSPLSTVCKCNDDLSCSVVLLVHPVINFAVIEAMFLYAR